MSKINIFFSFLIIGVFFLSFGKIIDGIDGRDFIPLFIVYMSKYGQPNILIFYIVFIGAMGIIYFAVTDIIKESLIKSKIWEKIGFIIIDNKIYFKRKQKKIN